jgi:hypothetical protein
MRDAVNLLESPKKGKEFPYDPEAGISPIIR